MPFRHPVKEPSNVHPDDLACLQSNLLGCLAYVSILVANGMLREAPHELLDQTALIWPEFVHQCLRTIARGEKGQTSCKVGGQENSFAKRTRDEEQGPNTAHLRNSHPGNNGSGGPHFRCLFGE